MTDLALRGSFAMYDLDDELAPYLFLRAHTGRGHPVLLKRDLDHAVRADVLPERATILHVIDAAGGTDWLAAVDDTTILLRTWRASADIWVSAPDALSAAALYDEVRARVPAQPAGTTVRVRFTDRETGSRRLDLSARPWQEVRQLYARDVAAAVDELVTHRPDVDESRRLLLWHGAPGTGKTSAIRALLHAWRDWADPVVVTDPEALLSSGKYLRQTVLDNAGDRWQLLVLEDAEALLHKGSGPGMAKLLNLADGLLGQGLRCLFLITTNEPLGVVHPALVRPGRCLAKVEFGPLPAAQVSDLLGRSVDCPMTLSEVMAARPVAVEAQPALVGQYL